MNEEIVRILTEAGGHLTRAKLWERLGLANSEPTDEYWVAEQGLVDALRIQRKRGRSGGIYLLEQETKKTEDVVSKIISEDIAGTALEQNYYAPVLKEILDHWTEQPGFTHVFAHITAGQGRRPTGGRWSRPDIVICAVSDWHFSSRPEGDIRTIEVKRFEALDVMAVYEAVSHKSRAHYSYLLIVNYPKELSEEQKGEMESVLAVAGKHGIGVITAEDATDWATWEFELDAGKSDADSQAIHQMLLDQVPPQVRDPFRSALRTIKVTM
jgi:hypothetical protein